MKLARRIPARAARGLTLIEITIAATIFTILGYALVSSLKLSEGSRTAVETLATRSREFRAASRAVVDALRVSNDDTVAIAELADENHAVTLSLPVLDGGALAWGVPASAQSGPGAVDQIGANVVFAVAVGADGERSLVRRVLRSNGTVQEEETLIRGLSRGDVDPPGFQVVRTGEVWEITISLEDKVGLSEVFHVHTRN